VIDAFIAQFGAWLHDIRAKRLAGEDKEAAARASSAAYLLYDATVLMSLRPLGYQPGVGALDSVRRHDRPVSSPWQLTSHPPSAGRRPTWRTGARR
jgi:hypothetical protein